MSNIVPCIVVHNRVLGHNIFVVQSVELFVHDRRPSQFKSYFRNALKHTVRLISLFSNMHTISQSMAIAFNFASGLVAGFFLKCSVMLKNSRQAKALGMG